MTSIQSFDTDTQLEYKSDKFLCHAVKSLDDAYIAMNEKLTRNFFHPNELRFKTRANLDQLYFDDHGFERRGLCDAKTVIQRQGNNLKTPMSSTSTSPFLVQPCNNKQKKFQNYIDCSKDTCCTVRHEMFGNMTKR